MKLKICVFKKTKSGVDTRETHDRGNKGVAAVAVDDTGVGDAGADGGYAGLSEGVSVIRLGIAGFVGAVWPAEVEGGLVNITITTNGANNTSDI